MKLICYNDQLYLLSCFDCLQQRPKLTAVKLTSVLKKTDVYVSLMEPYDLHSHRSISVLLSRCSAICRLLSSSARSKVVHHFV